MATRDGWVTEVLAGPSFGAVGHLMIDAVLLPSPGQFSAGVPPTVEVVSPTTGDPSGFPADYQAAKSTPIIIDAYDEAAVPGLEIVEVFARFIGQAVVETVYRNGGFRGNYIAGSSQAAITNGVRLSIRRDENWPGSATLGDVTIDVDALDGDGNRTTTSFAWALPASTTVIAESEVEPEDDAVDVAADMLARVRSQFRV